MEANFSVVLKNPDRSRLNNRGDDLSEKRDYYVLGSQKDADEKAEEVFSDHWHKVSPDKNDSPMRMKNSKKFKKHMRFFPILKNAEITIGLATMPRRFSFRTRRIPGFNINLEDILGGDFFPIFLEVEGVLLLKTKAMTY